MNNQQPTDSIPPQPIPLPFHRLHPLAKLPSKTHSNDAGLDLFAFPDLSIPSLSVALLGGQITTVGTGIAAGIPDGFYGQIFGRSGLASRGIAVLGGVVDSSYRGEIKIILANLSANALIINRGDKVAQLVVLLLPNFEAVEVDGLDETIRGDKGFGSSGQ